MIASIPGIAIAAQDSKASARNFDRQVAALNAPAMLDADTRTHDAALEHLRDALPPNDPARETRLYSLYCAHSSWKDPQQGLAYAAKALQLARSSSDREAQARALLCIANQKSSGEGVNAGLAPLQQALGIIESIRQPQLLAKALQMRGDLRSLIGDQAAALMDFQRAGQAYREAGIEQDVYALQLATAIAYRRTGDAAQALAFFEPAERQRLAMGDWEAASEAQLQTGFVHVDAGQTAQARAAFERAIETATAHAIPDQANAARLGLVDALIDAGDFKQAGIELDKADAGLSVRHDVSYREMQMFLRGKWLAGTGNHQEALARYDAALPLMQQIGNDRYISYLHRARARSLQALGRSDAALSEYERYMQLDDQLQKKMRLDQTALLRYENEIRRQDFENRDLRRQQRSQRDQVRALQRERRWQYLVMALSTLVVGLLGMLAVQQIRKSRALGDLAMRDTLTGVASRLSILDSARKIVADAHQHKHSFSLLCLDIDHFKQVNDTYGHHAGDVVLMRVANACRNALRASDMIGRIGGEEFLVLCPSSKRDAAMQLAERLRVAASETGLGDIDPALRTSLSIGVAELREHESLEAAIARADGALYRAKEAGRNRVKAAD